MPNDHDIDPKIVEALKSYAETHPLPAGGFSPAWQPDIGSVDLEPLPGRGASDPRIDRLAGWQEGRENVSAALDRTRGLGDRGTGDYAIVLQGERLAGEARTSEELVALVRREYQESHSIKTEKQAETLFQAAFSAFARTRRVSDPDFAWAWTSAMLKEYRNKQVEARRERVGDIARGMESSAIFMARFEWSEQVNELARESGLDVQFVEDFLNEYNEQTKQRIPTVIDPRGVPFIQAGAPLSGIATIAHFFLLLSPAGLPLALYEGVSGKDLLTGEDLETWERALLLATPVIPLVAGAAVRPAAKAIRAGARPIAAVIRYSVKGARELAALAVEAGISAKPMLRALGRLAKLSLRKARNFLNRIQKAKALGQGLRLTGKDRRFMRQLDEAFREASGTTATAVTKVAQPTAKGFIFLNRLQPKILGRLLDRVLSRSGTRMATKAAQDVEDAAVGLAGRIRAHWDTALPRGVNSAADAAQAAFNKMTRANPQNANQFIRKRLYDPWRKRAMRRIYNDQALRRDLKEQAGIIVGRNPKTDNITIHVRTKSATGQRVQTHLDFDHASIRHEDAVQRAIANNDFRELTSTVSSNNLQLMTARQNRNFIEAIRAADRDLTAGATAANPASN